MSKKSTSPATKEDITSLEKRTDIKFEAILELVKEESKETRQYIKKELEKTHKYINEEIKETHKYIKEEAKETHKYIKEEAKETRHHFDVVAENIHQDVAGANKDEISFIKNQKIPNLEKRVTALEQR